MEYDDYECVALSGNTYMIYRFHLNFKENVATFTLNEDSSYQSFIYPEFKGMSIGYVIKLFVNDLINAV